MGNILTQKRHKQDGTQIEDMTYRYQRDANGFLLSNRLYHVNDAIASTIDQTDIDDQGAGFNPLNVNINGAYNYVYDEEGRLVKDVTEGIHQIVWRVDGKVREINRTSTSTRSRLKFDYDAMGRRIAKHVYNNQTGLLIKSTYYLLDAQGNTMSTYDYAPGPNQTMSYQLKERHIFGSARLGMYAESVLLVENPSTENSNILVNQGFKQYEMTNHLGNVLTVIHDIKIPLNNGSVPGVSSYRVGIRTCSDYSPFGVELDGRTVSNYGYRFGYQGSEKDDEVKGNGNSYTTEFRQLDPRLGRWLCIDLLTHKYPYYSPYQYVHNSPISVIDLFGLGDPLEVMKIRRNRASNLQGAKARNSGTRAHQGFDLYAAPGTSAKAVKNAVVYDVSYSSSYGNTVTLEITDEKGTKSYAFYAHLSVVSVSKNQKVDEGDEIGLTGQTGNAKGQPAEDAHLHFELRSSPSPGLEMTGRLNPNEVLDTKFYSQDPEAINQATVGVLKEQKDGSVIKINLDGTEKIIKNKTNFQNLGQIRFDSSLAKEAKDVNGHKYLIVHDIKSQKDFGVVRKPDGSYDFYKKTQK